MRTRSPGIETYQSAHNNLARLSLSSRGGVNRLRGRLGSLGRFLHASDGGLGGRATVAATATALAAVADQVIKRLVQVGRHDEKVC